MHRLTTVLLALSLIGLTTTVFAAPLPLPDGKPFIVEGTATDADQAKARAGAILDAQQKAVRGMVALCLSADALAKNGKLLEENTYPRAAELAPTPEVLKETYRDGICTVQVRVVVQPAAVLAGINDLATRLQVAGNPRVIVLIAQPQATDAPGLLQTLLTEKLVELGFTVVDPVQARVAKWTETAKLIREGKHTAVDVLLLQPVADLMIVGEGRFRPRDKPDAGVDVFACDGWLDARVIRTDTAQIIAAAQGNTAHPAPAFSEAKAVDAALRAAGADWLQRNLPALTTAAVDPTHELTLTLTNCAQGDLVPIDAQLMALPLVRATRLLAFDKGLAQMVVQYAGPSKGLVADLGTVNHPWLEVVSATSNVVRARVK